MDGHKGREFVSGWRISRLEQSECGIQVQVRKSSDSSPFIVLPDLTDLKNLHATQRRLGNDQNL